MSNPKVFEFAKEIGLTPIALMDKIREWQIPVKSHMAELEPEVLALIKEKLSGKVKSAEEPKKKTTVRKSAGTTAKAATPIKASAVAKAAATPAKTDEPAAATAGAKAAVVRRKGAAAVANAPAAIVNEVKNSEKVDSPDPSSVEETVQKATTPPISETSAKVIDSSAQATADKSVINAKETSAEAPQSKITNTATTSVKTSTLGSTPAANSGASAPGIATATTPAPSRKKEVVVGSSGVASSSPARRNIIGRMDLSRVQPPPGSRPQSSGPGGQGGGGQRPGGFSNMNRPAAGRGLRAGFVATPAIIETPNPFEDENSRKKGFDKKIKRIEGGGGANAPREEEQAEFNAVEFRKRELVFQPKKKKVLVGREAKTTEITKPKASKRILKVNGVMRVSDAAQEMGLKAVQLIRTLMTNGVTATMNTELDFETWALVVTELGWEAQNVLKTAEDVLVETAFGNLDAEKVIRPPVVTIMGHVDHGKTSLLDAIRSAKVAAGEAGGITQHIGAYSVRLDDGTPITFLDTPGHEAFTAMRARGANATDIAIIVVAADDGMMPQTQEAVSHAKAAGVPIIVAINKMDKPGANPDRIKQQLTEMELVPEEWGGSTIYVPVSALKKTGLNELLEQIKLVAEVAELKANPERSATGLVIEAKMEKGRGPVASLLIKDGTLKVGQHVVAGSSRGRVRSLTNDRGERVQEVGPGFPVEILGLDEVPAAGDRFDAVVDEETADRVAEIRKRLTLDAAMASANKKMSLEDIFSKVTQGDVKEFSLILKADVHGSVEAIQGMIAKLSTVEVKTRVLHSAVGGITESDVLLASTAKAVIIGFNVRPDGGAQSKAKQLGVDIRTYSIVYELVDDLKKAMTGLLKPNVIESVSGRAEVRNTFTVPKAGTIAGCFVVDGKVLRSNLARLIRDGKIIYEGKISSLKRFKDDAREVAQGFECGIGIENFNDIKVGDVIEAFVKEEVARELSAPIG